MRLACESWLSVMRQAYRRDISGKANFLKKNKSKSSWKLVNFSKKICSMSIIRILMLTVFAQYSIILFFSTSSVTENSQEMVVFRNDNRQVIRTADFVRKNEKTIG